VTIHGLPWPAFARFRRLRRTEALRLGLRVDIEASEHTVEGLVQALRRRHQNKHLRLGKR